MAEIRQFLAIKLTFDWYRGDPTRDADTSD
jgi:hypothetical protein